MVNKGPFMEFLNIRVNQAVANTWTTAPWATPSSKTEKMAMLIHKIIFEHTILDAPAQDDHTLLILSTQALDQDYPISDPRIIAKMIKVFEALTSGGAYEDQIFEMNFNPPILYPKASIHLGIDCSGQANPEDGFCKIGYTLEKVSDEAFIAALVED